MPDELTQLAQVEARRRGISLSTVIRESLENTLRKQLPWQGIVNDPQLVAHTLDETLAASWAEGIAGDR